MTAGERRAGALTVCTGWSPAGWLEYGQRFAETFRRFWPADVRLLVYTEDETPVPGAEVRSVRAIDGCGAFLDRHADWPAARGRSPVPGWKPKDHARGYSWRFDAWKFSRQGFIPHQAALEADTEFLLWLDGDVVTTAPVPPGAVQGLLPAGYDVAYLGRGAKHSEIGFQLYRLPGAWPLLRAFRFMYDVDQVFELREWHSAFVWDTCRRASGVRGWDLTPGGSGHVWHQSPLRAWTDHLKGDRKGKARSPEARR